jgi:hypothetical protein
MSGRGRYATTFHVEEFWKGSPGRSVIIHGLTAGTDCLGGGEYEIGKEYLVYASESRSADVRLGDDLWYSWKDVLAEGTPVLMPTACAPSGEVGRAGVRVALRELRRGRTPNVEKRR